MHVLKYYQHNHRHCHYNRRHRHRHDHHLANMQFGHLLTHSRLTHREVSLWSPLISSASWSVVLWYCR